MNKICSNFYPFHHSEIIYTHRHHRPFDHRQRRHIAASYHTAAREHSIQREGELFAWILYSSCSSTPRVTAACKEELHIISLGACGKTMVASSSSPSTSPPGGAWEKRASARQDEPCTFGSNLYGVTSYDPIDEENHYPQLGREDEGGDLFMF